MQTKGITPDWLVPIRLTLTGLMLLLCVVFRPWTIATAVDREVVVGMALVIVVGTIIAFSSYMEGVRCAGPRKSSLYALFSQYSSLPLIGRNSIMK